MASCVMVTGAGGFVGSSVVGELLSRDMSVHALVHRKSLPASDPRVKEFSGDLFDPAALDAAMQGAAAVIHLVGIIMEDKSKGVTFRRIHVEGTQAVVNAAKRNGVRRCLQMSALGARPDAPAEYHRTKWQAEKSVRASGLDWTIFRPSLIHGPGGFMQTEAAWARKKAPPFVAMPYFGRGVFGTGGAGLLQPIYVHDVSRAFADAMENPKTIGKTYELAGPEQFTWPKLHEKSARVIVGHRRWTAALPVWVALMLAGAGLGNALDFSRDQVLMSQENNTADIEPFVGDFGWRPRGFEETLGEYAAQL